ncbi:hypothetical protein ACH5RR_010149 [Cinchona calisaya]|uniref:Uncharacterized protein n=1 Tax=Cinchona calisaya TaxID=153742 RepID=A0ABD3AI18_9GENT
MEYHLDKRNLRDQEAAGVIYSRSSQQACQSTKLGDRFKVDRNEFSSPDLHPKAVRNLDNVPQKSKAFNQRQRARNKADELVRYMSNLPSYLEKGENLQEKAFNVGVLEWRRLEKWQYNNRQVLHRSCKSSPSNSNASSFSSTEGSSSNSGRGHHSCSPANQRMHYPSQEYNQNTSPSRVSSHPIKSFEKNGGKFQDLGPSSSNYLKVSQSILSTHQCFNKYTDNRRKECKNDDPDVLAISEKRELQEPEDHGVVSSSKGKMNFHDSEPPEEKKHLQVPSCNHTTDHGSIDRRQPVVLHQTKDGQEIRSPAISQQSDLTGKHQQESMEANQHSFSNKSNSGVCGISSDIPHSCPLPHESNTFRDSRIEQPSSTAEKDIRFSSEPLPYSGKASASPSRGLNLEGKKSIKTLDCSAEASNPKMDIEEDRKVRNPSRIRQFIDRIGRNSSLKDTSCVPQGNPDADKFCSRGAETSVYSVDSCYDKSNATGKGRSSPLRRLLDPLLKPRSSDSDYSVGSLHRDSSPIDRVCKSSKGRGESAARHSVKMKIDLGNCKTINIDHPQNIGKCGSLTVQALLQVAVKNGLPLFTFAVDNSSNILAATMRKLSSNKKDADCWIYTFFTVHEMKKKNGSWLNQGSKDRTHGYIPNVVAQMKVSDVASTDVIRQKLVDQCTIREFVLLAANKRQGDQQISDLQANDELAAIVLKLPKMAIRNLNEGDQRMSKVEKLSIVDLEVPSQEVCSISESRDVEESGSSAGSMDLFDLAVIFPGGDHGLPSKGEPSPLIERWRSGGSCDCGGWDVGCRLRVLASQFNRTTSGPGRAQSSTGKFRLYSREQGLERKPIFSLSRFKEGIYSVEFDSSLKLLQAFSICIAFLNGLQPATFSEFSHFFENKSSEESTQSEVDGPKVSNRDQQEYSASNVSHPPILPVERV